MTIERLARMTLLLPLSEKDAAFAGLQELGCVHLVAPPGRPALGEGLPAAAERSVTALRYLRGAPRRRRQVPASGDADFTALVDEALANRDRRRRALARIDALEHRLAELAPFGDFPIPDAAALGGRRLWLFRLPIASVASLENADGVGEAWQAVARDNRNAWIVVVARQRPALPVAGAVPVELGTQRLAALEAERVETELELEAADAERHALTRWIRTLEHRLTAIEDQARLQEARTLHEAEGPLCRIDGWVARREAPRLEAWARGAGHALHLEPVHREDDPPTLLRNRGPWAAGTDLVRVFTTPGYHDWDPSAAVLLSFALFFGLILSDAGYAALLALLLLRYRRRLGATAAGQRFLALAGIVTGTAFAVGVLAGGWFGVAPPPDGLLGQLVLLDLDDHGEMMRLTLGIGVAHVLLGLAMQGVRAADAGGRLRAAGWGVALCGAFAHGLIHGTALVPGVPATITGAGLAVVVAGGALGGAPASLPRRLGRGLAALRDVTRLFGDVLSYLRLFALGLASSALAVTFNQLAADAYREFVGGGVLLAAAVLTLGHGVNVALGVIGGLVHGLRLNLIEFLSWSLASEGRPFRRFAKKGRSGA